MTNNVIKYVASGVAGAVLGGFIGAAIMEKKYIGTVLQLEQRLSQVTSERDRIANTLQEVAPKQQKAEGKYTDEKLLQMYQKFADKARQHTTEFDTSVIVFAQRSGIKPEQISEEDYSNLEKALNRNMLRDDDIKVVLDIAGKEYGSRLVELLNDGIDVASVKRIQGDFYFIGNFQPKTFSDPELLLPFTWKKPITVSSPRVYAAKDGTEAIELEAGVWGYLKDYGSKPGAYAKKVATKDLTKLVRMRKSLTDFLKQIRREHTPEQVEGLVRNLSDVTTYRDDEHYSTLRDVLNAVRRAGEGSYTFNIVDIKDKSLTFEGLRESEKEIEQWIQRLSKIAGK